MAADCRKCGSVQTPGWHDGESAHSPAEKPGAPKISANL